jgi:hypothetical protein
MLRSFSGGQGVLIKGPTVWLDGERSPQKNICNFIKINKENIFTESLSLTYDLETKLFSQKFAW